MYIPLWVIVLGALAWYFFYYKPRKGAPVETTILDSATIAPEDIEERVEYVKQQRIFELVHFDSPHFIDAQNAFDAMEVNYLRLKQRLSHTPDKVREVAKDWFRYAQALGDLKHARVMLDVDMSDTAFENMEERMKEPSIIKDEIEKKFKSLLGEDFQKIPPDYFERQQTAEKADEETSKQYTLSNRWEYYYRDSDNLYRMKEKRKKQDEEWEAKKKAEKEAEKAE